VPAPEKILPWLIGGAVGFGGILQGLHWRSTSAVDSQFESEERLRIVIEENEMLRRENESLRSLAQGGGEVAVQQEWIDHVEKEFDLKFLHSPVVHRIAGDELRDRVAASIESRMGPSGIEDRQEAWRLLGWIGAEDDLLWQLTSIRAVGASGWFDEVTGDAWVTDRFSLSEIPDQAVLLRLLTRVLLHQHFPPPPSYPGDDVVRAREALHHGVAAGSEARFLTAHARQHGFLSMQQNPEAAHLFASLPPFIRGITTFASVEGKGFADTHHLAGNEALLNVLRDPPQTTRSILQPASPGGVRTDWPVPLAAVEPYLTESAGQLGLRFWIESAGGDADLASSWMADRYWLVSDGEASTALIWDIDFSNQEDAAQFEQLALTHVMAMTRSDLPVKTGEVRASKDGRQFCVKRPKPDCVRFLNTATAELAGQSD
jgi:hypothetical protein